MLTLESVVLEQGGFRLDADVEVEAEKRVAIIGPSGAGKSTLLAGISGFLVPSQGRILIDGENMGAVPPGKRPVSILFQDSNLFPHLTAFENVALGIRPDLRLSDKEVVGVGEALARVGLDGLDQRKPAGLSGGQQSRVALARTLLRDKPVLLLDEPFAALGPALKDEMLDLVAQLCRERALTILMVSHDPQDARRLCPDAILVADGVARGPMPTQELLDRPPEVLRAYLGK